MKKNFDHLIPAARNYFPSGLKLLLCSLMLLLMQTFVFAQETKTVTGKVSSASGEPLPGATIAIRNSAVKTSTDEAGNFSIAAPSDAVLEITFVGYDLQEVSVAGRDNIAITLSPQENTMESVVIVGYTSQRKSSITGAITDVSMSDVEHRRVPDVAQLLQGQVAGVQVTQSTGAPGDEIAIRIRGEGTIGNNSPLYIIDGIPSRDISFINPADIRSMTVLKDAAAAAIYGSRASAGVIVITTRAGRSGRMVVDINYFNGIQKATNLPEMLNAAQYMDKMEESWNNSGYTGTNPYTADKSRGDLADTDWLDELFETGQSQNLQVSASGGSDKVQFLLSGGYYSQDGIVVFDNDKYQRYNFRTNINANLSDRLKVGTNFQLSNTRQDKMSSKGDAPGIIRHAFIRPPVIPVYKDVNDPTYSENDPYTDLPFYKHNNQSGGGWDNKYEYTSNPVALAKFTNDQRNSFRLFGNVYAEYAFLKNNDLKFRTNLGVDLNMSHNKTFNENFGDDDGGGGDPDKGQGRKNRPNSLSEDRGQETTITWNNTLDYTKSIGAHDFNILAGTEYISNYSSSIGASRNRFDYISAPFQYIDYGGSQADVWNGGSAAEWALFSLFGSVNYNYNNRYLVTASLRADASSRFAENNQWGYFPSVSAGWRISNENFMENVTFLSDLKLRASTGALGNQEIDNYSYLTLLRRSGDQYVISRYGNPDLKWESTRQDNIGLDFGLLRNKLYVTVDYFQKTTSDILLPISLPALVGSVSPTIVNAGSVSNKGFEFGVNYRNNDRAFKYNINANLATVKNNVEKLHPNLPSLVSSVGRTEVGHPLSSFYGYRMIGIYQNQAEINSHLSGSTSPSEKPGDIKFEDLNNDGIINDNDRTFIGNPNPALSYGFSFSAGYKGFDLSFLIQGVGNVDKYNDLKKIIDFDSRPFNHSVNTLKAWNGEGTSNTIPRSTFNDNGSSRVSSIFVEDASYTRLKNLELGYTFNASSMSNASFFQNARLYVSAQNLFTITNYTGLDPESYDMVDQGTYPQSAAVLFGINIQL